MPKMQSFNSNSEIYADFGLLRGEICKWLYGMIIFFEFNIRMYFDGVANDSR